MDVPIEVVQLAHCGAKIIPLRVGSKLPLLKEDWRAIATSDLEQLNKWAWQVPGCNWAMKCGPESNRFVLDCDAKNGKHGMEWLFHQLEEHGSEWIDTVNVMTPNDGRHLHYLWEDGIRKDNTGRIFDGVDIQGLGTYAVIPPSRIGDKFYRFLDCDGEKSVARMPQWLRELVFHTRVNGQEKTQDTGSSQAKVPRGQRHNWLVKHGCKLLDSGILGFRAFYMQLLEWNLAIFEEPKSQPEVLQEAKGIWDWYKSKKQRSVGFGGEEDMLQDSEAQTVEWLWEPYIPKGMLTILNGDPGVGKSYIALAIAAEETRKGNAVLYQSVENPWAQVVRPRFDSLKGDCSKLIRIKSVDTPEGKRQITLRDIAILEESIQRNNFKLVIFDPIQSYLGADIDAYRANETRPILDALEELAERTGCAILILRHMVKGGGLRAIHKGLGSIDFTGAVRSELMAGETAGKRKRAMVHIKSNIGIYGDTLGYEITAGDEFGQVYQAGFFRWLGKSDLGVADFTEPEGNRSDESQLHEAEQFLTEFLANGPQLQSEVQKEAREAGVSARTLRRAKKRLGIISRKRQGDGKWEWTLGEATSAAAA